MVSRLATEEELALVHDRAYIQQVIDYKGLQPGDDNRVCKIEEKWPTYVSKAVYETSASAVGSLLQLTDAVCSQKVAILKAKLFITFSI